MVLLAKKKSDKISLVIGGCGFIGSNVVRRLVQEGQRVVVADNLSLGRLEYIADVSNEIEFLETDAASLSSLENAFRKVGNFSGKVEVWHLAANSDIPAGVHDSLIDLRDTFMSTYNVTYLMERYGYKTLYFASSSAVYGDCGDAMIQESFGPLLPISNYGAMKLASEAVISAFQAKGDNQTFVYRFPNVVGVPATHGVILDFVKRLIVDPETLNVLGNGHQQKVYLHVSDLVDAMFFVRGFFGDRKENIIINVGPVDKGITVREIAEIVVGSMGLNSGIRYGEDSFGWVGDVPKFSYDISKLKNLGWKKEVTSRRAIEIATNEIILQEKVNA